MYDQRNLLQKSLIRDLELKDLQYDCNWNIEHYRGCLKSLERLANNNKQQMIGLKGIVNIQSHKINPVYYEYTCLIQHTFIKL